MTAEKKDRKPLQIKNLADLKRHSLKRVFDIMESGDKTIADLISRLADAHLLNEAYYSVG